VGAEEERGARVGSRLDTRKQVAGGRADALARVVLVHGQPDLAEIAGDPVGDLAFLARGARDRGQLCKELDDVRWHAADLRDCGQSPLA
jgi:hypothetical protein